MSTVLITGADRGLGFEFARQYASEGWKVIACCRHPEKADRLKSVMETQPKPDLSIETLDVTDDKNIASLSEKLRGAPIDVLLNVAGIFSGAGTNVSAVTGDPSQEFGTIDPEAWMRVFRTDTVAPVMVAQAFRKNLAESHGAKLIMISSGMGSIERTRRPGDIAYRTSKAALNAATRSLSLSLQQQGVIVVCLHPGWVKTDMGGPTADITPEESVAGMKVVIANLKPNYTGQFFDYQGRPLPW